jgi:hypothetical protein
VSNLSGITQPQSPVYYSRAELLDVSTLSGITQLQSPGPVLLVSGVTDVSKSSRGSLQSRGLTTCMELLM